MKKHIIILFLLISVFAQSQSKISYQRWAKMTTAQKLAIPVTDNTVVYEVFDTDLGRYETYNSVVGSWQPNSLNLYTSNGSISGNRTIDLGTYDLHFRNTGSTNRFDLDSSGINFEWSNISFTSADDISLNATDVLQFNSGGGNKYRFLGNGVSATFDFSAVNQARTVTFRDLSGTVAYLSDLSTGYVTLNTAQTITGSKTFETGTSTSSILVNNSFASSSAYGIEIDNISYGIGLRVYNRGVGSGISARNLASNGKAIFVESLTAGGTGIQIENTATTSKGIYLLNSSSGSGSGLNLYNSGTSTGILMNGTTSSSGYLLRGQSNLVDTFTLDKLGNITANSFIKSGGTSSQYLMADGSVSTGGGGGLSNVVEDLTPQLGGDLDLNSKNITGTGSINITGALFANSGSNIFAFDNGLGVFDSAMPDLGMVLDIDKLSRWYSAGTFYDYQLVFPSTLSAQVVVNMPNKTSGTHTLATLGDIPTGITINNTLTSTSTTEALSANMGKTLKDVQDTQQSEINSNTAKVSFPEAPIDGTQYARKDGVWEAVPTVINAANVIVSPAIGGDTDGQAVMTTHETRIDALETNKLDTSLLIDDDTMATATSSNIPSAESVKNYVDASNGSIDTNPRAVIATEGEYTEAYNESAPNFKIPITEETQISVTGLESGDYGMVIADNTSSTPYKVRLTTATDTLSNILISEKAYFSHFTDSTGTTWFRSYEDGKINHLITKTATTGFTDIDWSESAIQTFQFGTANDTLSFIPPKYPTNDLKLIVKQDAVGSRTLAYTNDMEVVGSLPTLTTTANAVDIITYIYDGEKYYLYDIKKDFETIAGVDPYVPPLPEPILRMNGGGALVTATDGFVDWEDGTTGTGVGFTSTGGANYNSSSITWAKHSSVLDLPDADIQAIYDNAKYTNSAITYNVPVANGTYTVRFLLGTHQSASATSPQSISLEGVTVLSGFQPEVPWGHQTMGSLEFEVTVSDGSLTIVCSKDSGTPQVNIFGWSIKQ